MPPALPALNRRAWNREFVSLIDDVLPLCDFFCLLLAGYVSTLIYAEWFASAPSGAAALADYKRTAIVSAALGSFILADKQFGCAATRGDTASLFRCYIVRFCMFGCIALLLGIASQSLSNLPIGWITTCFIASLLLTSVTRVVVAKNVHLLERNGVLTEVIAVVGAGEVADRLVQQLQAEKSTVEVVGVFDDRATRIEESAIKPAGRIDDLIALGATRKIDWILLTLPCIAEHRLVSIVHRLKALAVPIGLCPQNVGLTLPYNVIHYAGNGMPITVLADRPIKRWDAVIKSIEDIVLGGLITLCSLPLLALIALAIRLDSPGPIIFTQRRHTFNNREFNIYKFRTMRWQPQSADEPLQQTSRSDTRITRIGKFLRATSLDELPQLFNVLSGEMSLVGPRPHAVNMRTEDRLGSEITDAYAHRHRVKPGMTGWSQVNGARGATNTTAQLRRRIELDLYYIENWSPALDLKILFMTIGEVIKRTNAY